MGVGGVLTASILLQMAAAFLALRLVFVTKFRGAWVLIAAAILLMSGRRAMTLARLAAGDIANPPDLTAELLALAISILMLVGVARIAPVFRSVRHSEKQYRSFLNNAVVGVYRTTLDGKFVYANPALAEMLGYDSVQDLKAGNVATFYQEEGERQRVIESMQGVQWVKDAEVNWKRKDGSMATLRLSGRCLRSEGGGLMGFEMFAEDITETRALEKQLLAAQRMEAVGQLTGGVAHDFNNLLTVIGGFAQLIHSKLEPEHPLRPKVEEIQRASARATDLTRQLLAFSRRQTLRPAVLSLNDILLNMEEMLRRLISEDIELVLHPGVDLQAVRVDPTQMEQVIMNLAANARDAMPDGGVLTLETRNVLLDNGHVRMHVDSQPGPHVCLSFSDSGEGMPPEIMEKVFEPFFTTKEGKGGTGLGLATVYGIVKQSQGSIYVYSEPGRGTTFKIYLPVADGVAAPMVRAVPELDSPRGGDETILLVEDEEGVRVFAAEVLRGAGYRVLIAEDGIQAIEVASEHPERIHLLLSDVIMPGLGGRGLVEALESERPGTRVVYMSGYTGIADVSRGVLEENVDYLSKPFGADELLRMIREALDR